jgi:hypothetical protein
MAYIATPLSKELLPGTANYRVVFEFSSNTPATEPTFRRDLIITPDLTVQQGREWVYHQITNAKPKKSVADLIVVGTPVAPLAPAAAPAPTAFDVWLEKANRLARLTALGLTAAQAVTDREALAADVNATYQAAYVALL